MLSYRSTYGLLLMICGAIAIGAGQLGSERGGAFEGTLSASLGVGMVVYGIYLLALHFYDRR